MTEQEQGFVIRDRRASGGSDTTPHPAATAKQTPSDSPSQAETSHQDHPLPVTFSSFVISLGSSSLMLMGEQLDPRQGALPVKGQSDLGRADRVARHAVCAAHEVCHAGIAEVVWFVSRLPVFISWSLSGPVKSVSGL
ncbi:MAG: DUF1844 domain-containing protein [Nitrospira sp.]|nr:DUF1844 domain-containing protein [Nitrospira sp.]